VAGKAQVASAQSQVAASEMRSTASRRGQAGQRTTLDVLNAQQALVNARVALSPRSMIGWSRHIPS